MSDDDDLLAAQIRSVIETVGSAVPDPSDSHLAPPARSHPGSHRRWAMAAAAMLVVGGIAALLARRDEPAPTAPDTTSSIASTSTNASESTTTSATSTSACSASDLTATAEPLGDSAMSNTKLVIDVTNSSDRPCFLPETPPTLAGVSADGSQVPLVAQSEETFFGSPSPLDGALQVDETAVVWVGGGQPGVCDPIDATQTWNGMLLGLPDGTAVPFTTPFDTKCGIAGITKFGKP